MILERVEKTLFPRNHTCFDMSVSSLEKHHKELAFVSPVLQCPQGEGCSWKILAAKGTSCCHLGWKPTVEGSNKHDKRKKRLCSEILGNKGFEKLLSVPGNLESRAHAQSNMNARKRFKDYKLSLFFFLACQGIWDLRSPTRDQSHAPLKWKPRVLITLVPITIGSA